MTKALTYVELDIPYCALTYGVAPCQASLTSSPPTGTRKCYNGLGTCQDRANFLDTGAAGYSPYNPTTLRFAVDTAYLPLDIWCLPFIREHSDIEITPAILSLGVNLGQRATIKIKMRDSRYSDTGPGGDKYLSERPYNPFDQGSFWGKFRARHPYLRGRNLRLITGELGQTLDQMETRHFIVESINGPNLQGEFEIIGKDVLKLADGDRAQAPMLSNGFLNADINSSATTLTLSPTDVGSEYSGAGYAAIGGKEIVQFWHDATEGNDASTRLLINCNGTDGSTSFSDTSAAARTVNVNGNAQVDTAEVLLQGGALLLDGSGDYLHLANSVDWDQGTGSFTIDLWIRATSLATNSRPLMSHGTNSTNLWVFSVETNGAIKFEVISGGSTIITLTSAASVIITATTYHVALVRNGTAFNIYVDGVSVASTTDADSIPSFTGFLYIGTHPTSSFFWSGWFDEIRFSTVARWTTTFTRPTSPYFASSDTMLIERAKFNTTAQSHANGDRVQQCAAYEAQDVAEIIYDLMVTYADVPVEYIDLPTWLDETEAFLGVTYSALVADPTPVSTLLAELIEQAGLVVWWDDVDQQVRLQVLRGVTEAATFDPDNTLEGTLKATDQPDTRLSRINVYFGKINPLLKQDELSNYRSTTTGPATADSLLAEEDYGSPAIKTIYSRWIPEGGRAVADRLIDILFSRYRDPPRRFEFEVMRGGIMPQLGQAYRIEGWFIQDDTGAQDSAPIQLTRLNPRADRFVCEAEEMLFNASDIDLANRLVIIDADTFNINGRTIHDNIYPTPTSGDTVTFVVNDGVIVGSTDRANPAFDLGTWPAGVTVVMTLNGRIQGCGSDGAAGTGPAPARAGTAFYTRKAITITFGANGEIWGGGGGGQGGVIVSGSLRSIGGGGGSGTNPGAGGGGNIQVGAAGTSEAGGGGGIDTFVGATAGSGGNPGQNGNSGSFTGGYTTYGPGLAGYSIDGVSFVTTSGTTDILGPTIN